jgi:hypothetical protein
LETLVLRTIYVFEQFVLSAFVLLIDYFELTLKCGAAGFLAIGVVADFNI